MNDERRKKLLRIEGLLIEARDLIEDVKDAEQDAFDNMPENMQSSDKGEKMQEVISYLDDAYTSIDNGIGEINSVSSD